MSLFELFGDSSRRKLDSSQEKSTDPSFIPESDFEELIWENRQAMVQGGQSSRARKIPSMLGLPSYYNRDRGDSVLEASNSGDGKGISSSSGRLRTFEPGLNEFPDQVCDGDGDDDIVPWFHCPINDFLPELSGITENNFDLMKRNKETKFHSFANGDVNQVAFPSVGVGAKGSEATGSSTTSTSNVARGDPNSGNFVNFSYFSRPKSLNRSIGWNKSVERAVFSGKQQGPSAEVKQTNGLKCVEANQNHQPHQGIHPEDILPINRSRDENGGAGTKRDIQDAVEPVVASSVCSENVPDGVSDDPTCNLKRKCRETYDSETPSDDMEEDSIVLRAGTSRGNSSKRGRAAEVHNLSERRRRDRINEKMRALQELIPNCNKVDKATMLDEAIEYLKTLQIQVQMMSMGAGMYMPPMMFPRGMQPMAQIQALGMGFGFQMGMVEPNNGSRSLPPPMQATHLLNPYNFPVIGVPGLMSMQRPSMVPFPVGSGTQNNGSVAATTTGLKEPMVNDAVGCSTKSG